MVIEEVLYGGKSSGIINWFPNLLETQVDLITSTLTSLTSPLFITPPPKPDQLEEPPEVEVEPSINEPSTAVNHLIRRLGVGLMAAVYTGMMLALVMMVAVVLSVLLVNYWVEQPVYVKEKLHFDYTDVNPEAVVTVRGRGGGGGDQGVPVGHMFYVSVGLLLPDSDYNHDIGVFQLMAEVASTNGRIIARSSQPTMLQYRSHPIRLMRTFLMGFPLLFGFTRETQKITVQMLVYKEDKLLRTGALKITLMPRAGTAYLPQLYEAELLMHSKLPKLKELVHSWKWTFCVWMSSYIYVMLLMLIMCFFKPLLAFPVVKARGVPREHTEGGDLVAEREEKPKMRKRDDKEFAEALRKWQQYRRKRKAELLSGSFMEDVTSPSASSYTVTKDVGPAMEEDVGDSESVCLGG